MQKFKTLGKVLLGEKYAHERERERVRENERERVIERERRRENEREINRER